MRGDEELSYLEKRLAESFDPAILVEYSDTADVGKRYLDKMLTEAGHGDEQRAGMTRRLIFGLPTHGFAIRADSAKEVGMKVQSSGAGPGEWDVMQKWLLDYIAKAEDGRFIRYVMPKKKQFRSFVSGTPTLVRFPSAAVHHFCQPYACPGTAEVGVARRPRLVFKGARLLVRVAHPRTLTHPPAIYDIGWQVRPNAAVSQFAPKGQRFMTSGLTRLGRPDRHRSRVSRSLPCGLCVTTPPPA